MEVRPQFTAEEDSSSELPAEKVGQLLRDLPVHGAIIDGSGVIIAVNERWKKFAQETGMNLPNFGVGANYLHHCAYADATSSRLVAGLTHLIAGDVDFFSLIYPCHSATEKRWYLLLGFPYVQGASRAILLHIDISSFFPEVAGSWAPTVFKDEIGMEYFDPQIQRIMNTIEKSILSAIADRGGVKSEPPAKPSTTPTLSKRQQEVLKLMTRGMSNMEIARELAISPNTVKIHVSEILTRLRLASRTQAVHWALTHRPAEYNESH